MAKTDDEIKIKKSSIILLGFGIILILFIFLPAKETTIFSFESENGERFDGRVYINDNFVGNTKNGEIKISHQISLMDEVTFEGDYNSEKFIFIYEFEKEDLNSSEIIFPIEEEEIIDYIKTSKDSFENIIYLHWGHMPITYSFDQGGSTRDCRDYEIERIRKAFNIIENSTENIVSFLENEENGEISISCHGATADDQFFQREADALPTMNGKVITGGTLQFYTHRNCGMWPDVEIHEILHLFGFGHIDNEWSVMSPVASRCDLGKIDENIISCLKYTYSNGEFEGDCSNVTYTY